MATRRPRPRASRRWRRGGSSPPRSCKRREATLFLDVILRVVPKDLREVILLNYRHSVDSDLTCYHQWVCFFIFDEWVCSCVFGIQARFVRTLWMPPNNVSRVAGYCDVQKTKPLDLLR